MEERHKERIIASLDFLVQNTPDEKFVNLLNQFSLDKGLSPYMVQKINVGNNNEKKKNFYEMIPKRGPDAFNKLCECLYEVGLSTLAEHLRRDSRLLVLDGSCLPKIFKGSNRKESYAIKSKPRGHVLIINIMKFKYEPEASRRGSEKDVAFLTKIWTELDYNITFKEDLDLDDFKECVNNFIDLTKSQMLDSVFVFIMTHGKPDENNHRSVHLKTSDSRFISSEWILNRFSSIYCKHIADVPKVIFIQACRGEKLDLGSWVQDGSVVTNLENINNNNDNDYHAINAVIPKPHYSNLLLVFSTLPGFAAKRHPETGAPFIQELCHLIESKAKKDHLLDIIHKVDRNLYEEVVESLKMKEFNHGFQTVHYENFGFSKRFYLL